MHKEKTQTQNVPPNTKCSFFWNIYATSQEHCYVVHVSDTNKPCTFTACSVGTAAGEDASAPTCAGLCSHPVPDPPPPEDVGGLVKGGRTTEEELMKGSVGGRTLLHPFPSSAFVLMLIGTVSYYCSNGTCTHLQAYTHTQNHLVLSKLLLSFIMNSFMCAQVYVSV